MIKNVMASASEAEVGAMFVNGKIGHFLQIFGGNGSSAKTDADSDGQQYRERHNGCEHPPTTIPSDGYEVLLAPRSSRAKPVSYLLEAWPHKFGGLLYEVSRPDSP